MQPPLVKVIEDRSMEARTLFEEFDEDNDDHSASKRCVVFYLRNMV